MHEEFVGIYRVPQTDAGTNTTVTTQCVIAVEPTSEQVSLHWRWQHYWTENGVPKHIQDLESRAVSPHLEGHALNLTASGMLKQCTVMSTRMHHTHTYSPKVYSVESRRIYHATVP